jgi:transcriptional regulator with XRE-family HTH domain
MTIPDEDADLRLRIGCYLGSVRQLRKIDQRQAARELEMSWPHLSNIERGRARTGWKGLSAMATYYGYGIQQLIDEVSAEKEGMTKSPFTPFLIWSEEHGAWWGPGRTGYTRSIREAGRYSLAEASEIVQNANRHLTKGGFNELMVYDPQQDADPVDLG